MLGLAVGKALEGGGQLHHRLLAFGKPGAQHRALAGDQPDIRLLRGNLRLGLLDTGSDSCRLLPGPGHKLGGAGGFGLVLFGTKASHASLRLRLTQRAADGRGILEKRSLLRRRTRRCCQQGNCHDTKPSPHRPGA